MPSIPTFPAYLPPPANIAPPSIPIAAPQPPATIKGKGLPVSAVTAQGATRHNYALSSSADAVKRMNRHLGNIPPARNLRHLPPELIQKVAGQLDNPLDVLALAHADATLHATLGSELKTVRVDLLIENIRSAGQYNYALDQVRAMQAPLRAERIGELVRKSNHSRDRPVEAFEPLAAALEEIPPEHRGAAFGLLTHMLGQMTARGTPLIRDQVRCHATLLRLAQDMPAPLRRPVLTTLSRAPLPADAIAKVKAALDALGPAPERSAGGSPA
jgi:hypothetical protein